MVHHTREFLFITFSFMLAWCLMIIPLPYGWQWLRPEWLMLVLIYWVFAYPQSIGILTAWSVGLIMDILDGNLIGQYALALVIVAYLAKLLRSRLRLFPFWQQALVILVLVGFGDLTMLIIQWLIGHPPNTPLYWASTATSVLLWPWVNRLLRVYEEKTIG